MSTSPTGFGSNIVILGKNYPDWSLFAAWHSIRTWLPEANYILALQLNADPRVGKWANRTNVSRIKMQLDTKYDAAKAIGCPAIVIDGDIITVSDPLPQITSNVTSRNGAVACFYDLKSLDEIDGLCESCQGTIATPFIKVGDVCGSWRAGQAINLKETKNMTHNERSVIARWRMMLISYKMIKL